MMTTCSDDSLCSYEKWTLSFCVICTKIKVCFYKKKKKKERPVRVNQVSADSKNPSHSSCGVNYDYGFAAVVFESAPEPDCRFASSAKHLLANVNYMRDRAQT